MDESQLRKNCRTHCFTGIFLLTWLILWKYLKFFYIYVPSSPASADCYCLIIRCNVTEFCCTIYITIWNIHTWWKGSLVWLTMELVLFLVMYMFGYWLSGYYYYILVIWLLYMFYFCVEAVLGWYRSYYMQRHTYFYCSVSFNCSFSIVNVPWNGRRMKWLGLLYGIL